MKNFLLLFLSFIIISCSEKDTKPKFKTEAYATLEINHKTHLDDSIEVGITHSSIIPDDSKRVKQLVSTNSEFIHIEIDRASNADLTINNINYSIWLSPNDTIIINISESGEIEPFSGKFKEENEYFLAKKKELGFTGLIEPMNQFLRKHNKYTQFLNSTDSLSKLQHNFLSNYQGKLTEDFREFEKNKIIYSASFFKVYLPSYNQAMNIIEEPLPDNYFNFIQNVELSNLNAIYTRRYFDFLSYYFWRDVEQEQLKSLGGKEKILYLKNHLFKDANEFLDPDIKDYFLAHHLTTLIKSSEKEELDSISNKWNIKINKALIEKIINQKLTSNEVYEEGSKIENFEMLNEKGETVHISDYKDKIVYLNFWGTWCKPCIANIPDLNKFIESYHENKDVVFINLAIRSKEENWKESIQKFDLKGLNLFIPKGENHDRVRRKFGASGVPHYAILGKENILKVNYANKAPKVKTELDALLKANN